MIEQSGSEHRHLPDPRDRLRGRDRAVDRRHLQAPKLPRLRLLHPARDLGPGHLRQAGDDRPAPTSSARRRSSRVATAPTSPARHRRSSARGSTSSAERRSTARCTPTTRSWSATATRPSGAPPPTRSRSARRRRAGTTRRPRASRDARAASPTSSAPRHQRARPDPAADQRPARQHRPAGLQVHRPDAHRPQRQRHDRDHERGHLDRPDPVERGRLRRQRLLLVELLAVHRHLPGHVRAAATSTCAAPTRAS